LESLKPEARETLARMLNVAVDNRTTDTKLYSNFAEFEARILF
jgi:hypothetical protein